MNFELLAEDNAIESGGIDAASGTGRRTPPTCGAACWNRRTSRRRSGFLIRHAMDLEGVDLQQALDDPRKARGTARVLACPSREIDPAGLRAPAVDLALLPAESAAVTLRFRLHYPAADARRRPLLPLRQPGAQGPHLRRALPRRRVAQGTGGRCLPARIPRGEPWAGWAGTTRSARRYRRENALARRLFGIASDEPEPSQRGGAGAFFAGWFSHVQYLVMNPTGTTAAASAPSRSSSRGPPVDDKGRPVQAEIGFFYFNPAGAKGRTRLRRAPTWPAWSPRWRPGGRRSASAPSGWPATARSPRWRQPAAAAGTPT